MYSFSTSFSEYLQEEQKKYPELTFGDIQTLKESLVSDEKLPPLSGIYRLFFFIFSILYFNYLYFKSESAKIDFFSFKFYWSLEDKQLKINFKCFMCTYNKD